MFSIISDGETLLLILALLYLTECLIWVKKRSVAFVSSTGQRWRLAKPIAWLGNANGAMLILNPLPPPGRVFVSHLLPISISPAGVCAFNSQTLPGGSRSATHNGEFVSFSEIKKTSADGVYLLLNGQKFARCATSKQVKALAAVIEEAVAAKSSRREVIVRSWIAKQYDAGDAKSFLAEAERAIGPIRAVCVIAFVFMFVATPIVVTIFGLERLIIAIAAAMVLLAVQIGVMFYRAHRKFYPAESQERFENLVKMILCPPVSLRAADLLTRNLLAEYSPVVVAGVLEGAGEQQFVRGFVLDLQHPLNHEIGDERAAETIEWMSERQLESCLAYVERVDRFRGFLDPAQQEGDAVSYCPRCGVQFVSDASECPDCPGVELVAFLDSREEGQESR